MLGEKELREIAKKVLSLSKASATEVLLFAGQSGLTRFANNQIHQNVASQDCGISVRVVDRGAWSSRSLASNASVLRPSASDTLARQRRTRLDPDSLSDSRAPVEAGARIGVASTNSFSDTALRDVVRRAENLAKLQKVDPHFVSLPKPHSIPKVETAVGSATPQERARAVATIIKKAKDKKIVASGAYDSSVSEVAVANSHGVWAYHKGSALDLSTVLMGGDSTGFAGQLGKTVTDIDAEKVADRAIEKVMRGRKPRAIKPGQYDVVLEPQAVGEMMAFFAWLGPNARIYHEKASWLTGKLGRQVFGKNITIVDDPLNKEGFPMPFDFEGYPKHKTEIIKQGKFVNVVYDSYNAGRFGKKNTGHALPAPNTAGPIPLHLRFEPGEKSLEEMIRGVRRGLLVTRLWYIRTLNPKTLLITGMTRDGTFLILNGEVVGGVRNLRFNQSIPEALQNVVEVGRDLETLSSFETELGTNRMPALHIRGWNFTSTTEF